MDNHAAPIPLTPLQPEAKPATFRKFFWLAAGFAILAFGVALGIFSAKFLNQSSTQPQLASTLTAAPSAQSPIPSPVPDPTANWKTYTNNTYQFSFKFPAEWQLTCTEPKDNDWLDATICQLTAPNTQLDHGYLSKGAYVAVGISKPTPNYSSLKEYVTDSVNRGYISSPKTYNNVSGYLLSPPESPKTYSNFVFESKGYIVNINWVPTDENNPNYLTINQILSTFKFLDK